MIVKIGTRKLAIGVDWCYADSKATVRSHIKAAQGKHVVHLTSDIEENWVGTSDIPAKEKKHLRWGGTNRPSSPQRHHLPIAGKRPALDMRHPKRKTDCGL